MYRVIKYFLGIGIIVIGLFAFSETILGGLLIASAGLTLIPPISDLIKQKSTLWTKKPVRIVLPVFLFLVGLVFIGANVDNAESFKANTSNNSSKPTKKVLYASYQKQVNNTVEALSEERKQQREKTLNELSENPIYILLVIEEKVSPEFLPLLHAIANGVSYIQEETFFIDEDLIERIESFENGEEKVQLVVNSILIAMPMNGGFTNDLIEVFERYKNRYGYYGEKSIVYSKQGNTKENIELNFDLAPIFGVLNPSNKDVLNAIYEAKNKGLSNWNDASGYVYSYVSVKADYNSHVKKEFPKSPYVLNVDYELTAFELYSTYDTNEVAADNKYKNKSIAVTGVIESISETLGQVSVYLQSGDRTGWTKINCRVRDRNSVSKLRKGQTVTLIGICKGMTLNLSVDLENCEVWE